MKLLKTECKYSISPQKQKQLAKEKFLFAHFDSPKAPFTQENEAVIVISCPGLMRECLSLRFLVLSYN